jgi:DNA-binding NarL/FixJ family response regulator
LLDDKSRAWVVCGEATNGEEAVREVAKLLPDVILLDVSIPVLHGLRVAQILKTDYPAVAVILVSEHDTSLLARFADAAETPYCIPKSRAALDLIPMLRALQDKFLKTTRLRSD